MKPRIEFDVTSEPPAGKLANPDAHLEPYDASEQQFAASLEETAQQDVSSAGVSPASEQPATGAGRPRDSRRDGGATKETAGLVLESPPAEPSVENPGTWQQEVAARLDRYRTRRRPREPRYPSLRLKFELTEPMPSALPPAEPAGPPHTTRTALAVEAPRLSVTYETAVDPEESARIIPFPRSAILPPEPLEELAGPVIARPRILEAPEIAPPPPALGGILIEPSEEPMEERRPGIELPLQSAALSRRLLAGGVDAVIVVSALALFAYIFLRVVMTIPPLKQTAAALIILATVFWTAYQYLLLVSAGTTPGLKLAKLRLSGFDGSAVPRRARRWRVLASVLSAVSLGLGYAWCILDEDELCWHDRITGTHLAPMHPPRL